MVREKETCTLNDIWRVIPCCYCRTVDHETNIYLYTEREVEALLRGGVHQIYIGNLPSGEHELVAYFVGRGPKGRDFKRGANRVIDKGLGAKYLELKITDRTPKHQPDFVVKEWE